MTPRQAAWLAWTVCAVSLLLAAVGLASWLLFPESVEDATMPSVAVIALFFLPALVAFPVVGALVASRQPRHPIGWLFTTVGLAVGAAMFAIAYAWQGLAERPGSLPAPEFVALAAGLLFPLALGTGLVAIAVFPTGRLPSRRWRPIAWLLPGAWALYSLAELFMPGPVGLDGHPASFENPLGIAAAESALRTIMAISDVLTMFGLVALVALILVRFRRSRGVERLQMKWFLYAGGLMSAGFLGAFLVHVMAPESRVLGNWFWGLGFLAFGPVPVAVGVAILRHRLYDIDLVIRRTLVYGALTAALGFTYWGLVVLMQQLLRPFTEGSELAIIASTLAVAAVFQPARRRIQDAVDRRFYRRKYDAQRTLEAFSARLRQETELDRLSQEMLGVVRETVQPAKVSLWLRAARSAR